MDKRIKQIAENEKFLEGLAEKEPKSSAKVAPYPND